VGTALHGQHQPEAPRGRPGNRRGAGRGARPRAGARAAPAPPRDRSRAEVFAREHGIERAHGSYEELLEDPEVEAIYNPLPNSMHVPWSVRALEAGKHVLCEKPLTRRPAEAEEAFAAAERSGRLLMEAFMWRHHPQTLRLRELLDEGVIGRLRLVRASFSFPLRDPEDIRLDGELDGGALMDVGCYCLSGSRFVAGAEPERVSAEQVIGGKGVDVALSATLRFPDDVLAQFDCGLAIGHRHELEAIGEDGSLYLADPWHGRSPGIRLTRGDEVEAIEIADANPYTHELENFARAARGEAPPRLGRADALAQARAIEALYASAASGRSVALEAPVA
jgi:xylose dehydrogenase (NAD/NADP)